MSTHILQALWFGENETGKLSVAPLLTAQTLKIQPSHVLSNGVVSIEILFSHLFFHFPLLSFGPV